MDDASQISQMKWDKNRRLKRMYADQSMQADFLKESWGKFMVRPAIARVSCVTHWLA
jgi:putative transposase